MKRMVLWSSIFIVIIIAISIGTAFYTGDQSPIFATGRLFLDKEHTNHARGIRTLFITVYDRNSPMPMPYGAMRETLSEDANGEFFEYLITEERLQVMRPGSPKPTQMRIKARLDVDGQGGRDTPGDITGEVDFIKFGSTNVDIRLDKLISGQTMANPHP